MREIKFRAWHKDEKRMINPVIQLDLDNNPTIAWYEDMHDALAGKLTDCPLEYVELMQYTGLRDKNGKEIYEGDIVSTDLSRPYLVVEFRNGGFVYQCHDGGKDYYDFMEPSDTPVSMTKFHEVIGNIYDNPELLEVKP